LKASFLFLALPSTFQFTVAFSYPLFQLVNALEGIGAIALGGVKAAHLFGSRALWRGFAQT
jgi:hypothetical protein